MKNNLFDPSKPPQIESFPDITDYECAASKFGQAVAELQSQQQGEAAEVR